MQGHRAWIWATALALSACGGGGGGSAPAPSGSISLDKTTLDVAATTVDSAPTGTVTVTISLTGATSPSVTATSSSSGIASVAAAVNSATKATVTVTFKSPASLGAGTFNDTVTIKACTDSGCGTALLGSPATVATHYTVSAASTVTVSGKITFDKVPGNLNGIGLNYAGVVQAAVRGVVVEAVKQADGSTLASSSTDANGNFALTVPQNTNLFIRARAELVKTGPPVWHFSVLNNTNSNALYVLDGTSFNSGTANSQRNLNAGSGWNGAGYSSAPGARAAAPFAVLDVAYKAANLVLSANPTAVFPDLNFYWSVSNKPSNGSFLPATGDIQTTQFIPGNPANGTKDAIYVLGDENVDTDEYDDSVIAHEWGHYFQDAFSRDDSFGGVHALNDLLDLRVAFSEGWGDAFSGMATGKDIYQDAQGSAQSSGNCSGLENDTKYPACGVPSPTTLGWYNEISIERALWDFYDAVDDGPDTVSLGFAPIYAVMANAMKSSVMTSIYPFATALKANNPTSAAGIDAILAGQSITVNDAWATGETNDAGDVSILPIFATVSVPGTVNNVCSNSNFDPNHEGNKIGISKFLKFTLPGPASVTFTATKTSGTGVDPDMELYNAGLLFSAQSTVANKETFTQNLSAGTYVLEVYESQNTTATPAGKTCFSVQFQ